MVKLFEWPRTGGGVGKGEADVDQVSFGPPTRYLRNNVLMGTELLLSRSEP